MPTQPIQRAIMQRRRLPLIIPLLAVVPFMMGCPPRRVPPVPLEPIPLAIATSHVNANAGRFGHTLRAVGPADGVFVDGDGKPHRYSVDGVLFYLAPRYLRFDLKKLGRRQLLCGSNSERYWVVTSDSDEPYCGIHESDGAPADDMPVRPDQMVEALGLLPIAATSRPGFRIDIVQRIVDEYQQVLFVRHGPRITPTLVKEYWVDRAPPRLIRRVIFRDEDGNVQLHADLNDYRIVAGAHLASDEPPAPRKSRGEDGGWLPYEIFMEWPAHRSWMRFRVARWTIVPGVGPDGPQFTPPSACR